MAGHTKEKWDIQYDGNDKPDYIYGGSTAQFICGFLWPRYAKDFVVSNKEYARRKANARLIATAPLMLDELRKQEFTLNTAILATPTGDLRDLLTNLNIARMDVIRKATS